MRWLVELAGAPFDLEELPAWFPGGDVFVLREGDQFYLTGPALEKFEQPGDVYNASLQLVDELYGVGLLMLPSLRKPKVGTITVENDDGSRSVHHVIHLERAEAREKASAFVVRAGGKNDEPEGPTEAQKLLDAARADTHLKTAMMLWADPPRSWPRLYRILEEIEASLGRHVNSERERFRRSANGAEVAGKDARHRGGKYQSPPNPMSLSEADNFIAGALRGALSGGKSG
jgi:hypothetical protein